MSTRPTIEKEINDARRVIANVEKEVKQLRDWISANERALAGMSDTLQKITEEGIAKARADLAHKENELQRLRTSLADNQKILSKIDEIEKKEREIAKLEEEQERIIVLLEKHRSELIQLKSEYDAITTPSVIAPCELVLPDNQRISLDVAKGEYVIGCLDTESRNVPDIDLNPVGGLTQGVSRRHAIIRFVNGQWTITDLGSTNGTFVNERQITPNAPTILQDKSKLRLGNVLMFFRYITKTTRL
jgi:hypothetical protein